LIAFTKVSQAFLICSAEIINGGEMRRQLGANKNQSVSTPLAMQRSMIILFVSNVPNSTASHKPNERTDLIFL
jgi:hypothetical protein